MRHLLLTSKYKQDYRLACRRGYDLSKLDAVIDDLVAGKVPAAGMNDHALRGNYKGHRECHIEPDWLLIYRISHDDLILTAVRTGTHSDLFYG
ncbi:MAG: type II toxin-antitoxin system YafQ family toxin [Dehalococcoidia bacterium]|nr:type II toxin-antitoxin system YafQ family toxin [Dehalococcoidia bacterium]